MAIGIAVAAVVFTSATSAGGAVDQNVRIPVDTVILVPCANGGLGENVHFQGWVHMLSATSGNDQNSFFIFHVHHQLTGVGLVTGSIYRQVSVSIVQAKGGDGSAVPTTTMLFFNQMGPGGLLFRLRSLFHTTINANGEQTAGVFDERAECL